MRNADLKVIIEALKMSGAFKVYGEGRDAHAKNTERIIKALPVRSDKSIRAYCEGCFYSVLEGRRSKWVPWEPFEHYDRAWIEEQVENMVESLTHFMEGAK